MKRKIYRKIIITSLGLITLICLLGYIYFQINGKSKTLEGEVIEEEPGNTHHGNVNPVGLVCPLQDTKQNQIDAAAGERLADSNLQDMREHEGTAIKEGMENIEYRCHKQEGELDGFRNACQEGSQTSRQQEAAHQFFLLRFCRMIHGQAGTQKSKHHGDEAAGHKSGNADVILRRIRVTKLGKENPLRAFHQLTLNDFRAAQSCGPEGKVEDMMQTERAKHTQHKTINQSADIARGFHQTAHAENQLLEMRPNHKHGHTQKDGGKRRHDGHEPRTTEEA